MLKSEATELPLKKLKKKKNCSVHTRSSNPLATEYICILMTMYTNTIHITVKMISYILTLCNFKHVQQ